jgi:rhamnogalacturonyl hydrolase YesR
MIMKTGSTRSFLLGATLHALLLPALILPALSQAPPIRILRGEEYSSLTGDGAWCWFSDPRAVADPASGAVYAGWATSGGDIVVARWDPAGRGLDRHVVHPQLQKDDHINPALLVLPDGRLMVFYGVHGGATYCSTQNAAGDFREFSPPAAIDPVGKNSYVNPVLLSGEHNRIYLFFRSGKDWKPAFVTSDDLGKSWSAQKSLVAARGADENVRPYMKVVSDGKSRIHFAFTDGHPRDEALNSVYYMSYEAGKFRDASGKVLGTLSSLPIDQGRIPRVYDARSSNVRAWVWDVAADGAGRPSIAFTTLPQESKHEYRYAAWDGSAWRVNLVCDAGSWFPRLPRTKEEREAEPHYSGGIALDHADPRVAFLSRPHGDTFEIERWETPDGGERWSHRAITANSLYDNVRPVGIAGRNSASAPALLWMNLRRYRHYTDYLGSIVADMPAPGFSGEMKKREILGVMDSVATWQMRRFPAVKHHELDWTNGALYRGIFAWGKSTGDERAFRWLKERGARFGWQPGFRMYHADDACVLQTFLDLSRETGDRTMAGPAMARADWVIAHPSTGSMMLDYADPTTQERWSWCDALFMAPPVYAKLAAITGEKRYLDFMHDEFRATTDLLYDRDEHLYYRDSRFIGQKEANGRKLFWGRGNGWVMGGLVAILKELPAESPIRGYYERLFTEMAASVAAAQDANGAWHASLLDPVSYPNPETSSSGFFCYALAYGVNAGLLPRGEYLPRVKNAWAALVDAVDADGKLGWVQPIGEDPKKTDRSMTEVYGVGAFLLAGSEVVKLAE